MVFAFSPTCCCNQCLWFNWVEPANSPAAFLDQVSILEGGSGWSSYGDFVQWNGSGGSTGRLLLGGAANTMEYAVTVTFQSLPSGDDDTVFRIYLDCGSTPGTHYVEVRTGGSGYIKVVGATVKELLYPWQPNVDASLTACIQKEPNSSGQYYLSCVFLDNTGSPGDGYSVVTETLAPTQRGAILECSSTSGVLISSVVAQNHLAGSWVCENCGQDCGCPDCILEVEISEIGNVESGYKCSVSKSNPSEDNAIICDDSNGNYFLKSGKGIYNGNNVGGSTKCVWYNCTDITPGSDACSLLQVVSMQYDPTSGDTTFHAGLHLLSGTCEACTETSLCLYSPTDGWDIPLCCVCSSNFYKLVVNTGGAPQNCGLLSELTLEQVDSGDAVYTSIVNGQCCDISEAVFTVVGSTNNCAEEIEEPIVAVKGNGIEVSNHETVFPFGNGTDFGLVAVGASKTQTFVVYNNGTEDLHLGQPFVTGATDFHVSALGTTTVAAGDTTEFTVTYSPTTPEISGAGCPVDLAWIEFTDDDPANDPFWFTVRGQSTSGTISVNDGDGHSITSGDAPTTLNHTDFGTTAIGSGLVHDFTIHNTGTNVLAIGVINITGANPGDFLVSQPGDVLIAPGDSASFPIEFDPLAPGTRTATVVIPNSDCVEGLNVFEIEVKGFATGTAPTEPPDCPSDTTIAYLTIYGMFGPDVGCPNFNGTFPVPYFNTCEYFAGGIIPPNSEYASFLVTYTTDMSGSPITMITIQFALQDVCGFTGGGLHWEVTISGWLTSFSGVNLGTPTWAASGCTCDTTGVVGILSIS